MPPSRRVRHENRHGFALLRGDIPNRFPNILILPQPARTSMARPASAIRSVSHQVQPSAGVGFEIVHDFLGLNVGLHDHVHMIRSHMCSQQTPNTVRADLPQGLQHGLTAISVHRIRRLLHPLSFPPRRAYRARFIAVQVPAIARKSDELPHAFSLEDQFGTPLPAPSSNLAP